VGCEEITVKDVVIYQW